MQCLEVNLSSRSYPIFWGEGLWPACIKKLRKMTVEDELFLISDTQVMTYYGQELISLLENAGFVPHHYLITPGENSKTWFTASQILEVMLQKNFSRQVPLLALGGGVVGDLAGFVAALYRRGVPFIQIPTTLLAQVDSAVGGKVAVNHPQGKNMLGTFYQPEAVWLDLRVLNTLPQREWRAGLGEVLKYAILAEPAFLNYLESEAVNVLNRKITVLEKVVKHCLQFKIAVVEKDEFDYGRRQILNLGHTFAHALEKATNFSQYLHGEAVALGLVIALNLACDLGMLAAQVKKRLIDLLRMWGLPESFPAALTEKILLFLADDKKVARGQIQFVLPRDIGKVEIKNGLPQKEVQAVLQRIAK
ncbi:MAG TPA: 3-dehydroquinate synthase [Clostridia bacterium]|nr:3-dehydroquinate synthase [Clostridia bacterium]